MGYKSFLTPVKRMLDNANEDTAKGIAEFATKKARDRAPVMGGRSADGRYVSKSRRRPKAPPGTYRKQIKSRYDDERIVTGSDDILGVYLEKGTKTAPPFPHIEPAYTENPKEIKAIVRKAYDKNVS